MFRPKKIADATILKALTHHYNCRSVAEKAVGPIWSWPIQHVQSAEKNTDGLKRSQTPVTELARLSDDR